MVKKILIIGGTNEGNILASFLENHNFEYIISYAGIVEEVYKKTFRKRVGGFGGKTGILDFIKKNKITHVIDASHPFSIKISVNTFNVCESCNIPIVNFTRKPWAEKKGDNWIKVRNFEESVNHLKGKAKNVFLAIGKKNLHVYKKYSQHFYLLRVINNNNITNFFPNQKYITYDPSYNVKEEVKVLKNYKIDVIVSKNSGGELAYCKIVAARKLKIPVIIIARPKSLNLKKVYNLESVLRWLDSKE